MSIRAQTLNFFYEIGVFGLQGFPAPLGPMEPIWAHGAHGAHGDPWALGPAATHPPGTETETTDTATRAAPIANAPRDRIRRAGRFTPSL